MNPKTKVTLEDISSKAGVSVATVSHALTGKGRVSAATRERVLQIVEELSYHPDLVAQSLARRRASEVEVKRERQGKGKYMLSKAIFNLMDVSEFKNIVQMEIQQMDEEGRQVKAIADTYENQSRRSKNGLLLLYHDLISTSSRLDFPYHEPDTYEEICRARPQGPRSVSVAFTTDALYNRLYGAWLGRSIGCVLGKPIEAGWSKHKVVQFLKLARSYPLSDYIPRVVPLPAGFELNPESDGFFKGEIEGVPYDDDIDYTVLALHIIESHGVGFKTADIATEWLGHLPYFRTYTAERIAYRNISMNVPLEEAAITMNPAREWIGARIRVDLYGMIAPGKPELAAYMAYRDAALSHTKNGIYAAMFMAAAIAWSFVTDNMLEIIQVALSEIPDNCRLSEAIRYVTEIAAETDDWEIAYDRLLLRYGDYHPVHSINNTAFLVLALIYGKNDFQHTLCTAVTCGLDTDCNGANAGSVLGILTGAYGIPEKWSAPLQDKILTSISQWEERRISELARRTAVIAGSVLNSRG